MTPPLASDCLGPKSKFIYLTNAPIAETVARRLWVRNDVVALGGGRSWAAGSGALGVKSQMAIYTDIDASTERPHMTVN
jgi:hypothetical protein